MVNRRVTPKLIATRAWVPGSADAGLSRSLLSDEEAAKLATIATISRFRRGDSIYTAGAPADAVYIISSGLAKVYRQDHPGAPILIFAFALEGDIMGMADDGAYSNSAIAANNVTAYRIPVKSLRNRMLSDLGLDLALLAKLVHELRASQRHAFILSERLVANKIAMFIEMLEQDQTSRLGVAPDEVHLPMSRRDIGEYLAATPAAISRGFKTLEKAGVLRCRDNHHVAILDQAGFTQLVNGTLHPGGDVATRARKGGSLLPLKRPENR